MHEEPREMSAEELYNEIIDSLVDSELDACSSPEDYLNSQGVDTNLILKDGICIVNQWKNKVRLEKRRQQFNAIKEKLHGLCSQSTIWPKEDLRQNLVDIFSGGDKKLAMIYWHKLESISDSDLENMIKEQNLLDSFIELFEEAEESIED